MSYSYLRVSIRPPTRYLVLAVTRDSNSSKPSIIVRDADIETRLEYATLKTGHTWTPLLVITVPESRHLKTTELAATWAQKARKVSLRLMDGIALATALGLEYRCHVDALDVISDNQDLVTSLTRTPTQPSRPCTDTIWNMVSYRRRRRYQPVPGPGRVQKLHMPRTFFRPGV